MTMSKPTFSGGCTCGRIRYRLTSKPLFTHCCHCHWCQRETGSSYAINALIEAERVIIEKGQPVMILTPTLSGQGQKVWRCPDCHIALWSNYAGAGDSIHFVRVSTLDDPNAFPPDIHIFTESKQPWVVLPADVPAVPQYYDLEKIWPQESLERKKIHDALQGR